MALSLHKRVHESGNAIGNDDCSTNRLEAGPLCVSCLEAAWRDGIRRAFSGSRMRADFTDSGVDSNELDWHKK